MVENEIEEHVIERYESLAWNQTFHPAGVRCSCGYKVEFDQLPFQEFNDEYYIMVVQSHRESVINEKLGLKFTVKG